MCWKGEGDNSSHADAKAPVVPCACILSPWVQGGKLLQAQTMCCAVLCAVNATDSRQL